MFERLIDLLIEGLDQLKPFVVIPYYDRGVRLRLGIPKGKLEPGFHWKIPFADEILTQMVMTKTINLSEQTVTTQDGISVVVKAVIKYAIADVEKTLLEVNDPTDAVADMVQGIIRDKIVDRPWVQCNESKLTSDISRSAKAEAKKWGIEILEITLTDLAQMRSIRLLNSTR